MYVLRTLKNPNIEAYRLGVPKPGQLHAHAALSFYPPLCRLRTGQEIRLIDELSFIKNKTHWGAAFRFGQLKIPAVDFKIIAEAMGCNAFRQHLIRE